MMTRRRLQERGAAAVENVLLILLLTIATISSVRSVGITVRYLSCSFLHYSLPPPLWAFDWETGACYRRHLPITDFYWE